MYLNGFHLKVVNNLDELKNNTEQQAGQTDQPEHEHHEGPAGKYIRWKPFFFIMLIFTLILSTSPVRARRQPYRDEKVV